MATPPGDADGDALPRSDAADAAGWMLLGAAVLAGSLAMDRLEDQDVPPFAAPGLLPGLLGILLLVLGGVLLARSLARGVRGGVSGGLLGSAPGRALWVIGWCVLFGTVLVGHGLPFWLAAAVFVAVAILSLRPRPDGDRRISVRGVLSAACIGFAAGLGITAVFQQLFLVRLP